MGYMQDRFKWRMVGFGGGINGDAAFGGPLDSPVRLNTHFPDVVKPRAHLGDAVMVIGQMPQDASVWSCPNGFYAWAVDTCRYYIEHGYPVLFRPHPRVAFADLKPRVLKSGDPQLQVAFEAREMMRELGVTISRRSKLADDLERASVVVTYSSNAGVDAALAGWPVVAAYKGSMAWDVATHSITAPLRYVTRGERQKWAAKLAWCQWSDAEMRSGECWDTVAPPNLR
jgi:hypothetical protein